jgi:hypothetical protein
VTDRQERALELMDQGAEAIFMALLAVACVLLSPLILIGWLVGKTSDDGGDS